MPPVSTPQPAAAAAQYGMLPPVPPTNAGWAVAAVVFFWPLAFSAFTHSSNVFPLWSRGDHAGAQYASDRAKTLGKISLGLFFGLWALFIVFYVIIIAVVVANSGGDTSTY
ncbi:CD225/dispanin family protein [Rhodococcus sp. D2-41]|nr:CD225/dispanin family protein [Rhodococcus sp. D2-41]